MPLSRITTKNRKQSNGIRLEKGMSVDVVSQSFSNPVTTNGGQAVVDAFLRIYGVDISFLVTFTLNQVSSLPEMTCRKCLEYK